MDSDGLTPQPPLEQQLDIPTSEGVEAAAVVPLSPAGRFESAWPGWRRNNKPLWPAIALAMLVIAGFVGLRVYKAVTSASNDDSTTTTLDAARLPVRTVTAETGLAQGWVFDEGSVWPVRRRVLNFQANGDITFVAKINGVELREGDFVSQGQLLATIDSRRQQSSIVTAQADIQVSQSQRSQAEASLQQAEANLQRAESDLALARTELRRNESLFSQGAVSESTRDSYENQVQQAEAALLTAQQDVFSAEQGIQSADASIGSSQARLAQTAVDLEDTQLVSPIDGVVAYINIREGEYWS
ncbi:MAG: biotin/lipoyl-binding protein, partial [Cyanobacteria bacterium J06632_22]